MKSGYTLLQKSTIVHFRTERVKVSSSQSQMPNQATLNAEVFSGNDEPLAKLIQCEDRGISLKSFMEANVSVSGF